MYIVGQEETVGESSVSSGCWGEDSDHKYGWARRTPTFVAPIRFFHTTFRSNPNYNLKINSCNAGHAVATIAELQYAHVESLV